MNNKNLIPLKEVATMFGLSEGQIRNYKSSGILIVRGKLKQKLLFDIDEVTLAQKNVDKYKLTMSLELIAKRVKKEREALEEKREAAAKKRAAAELAKAAEKKKAKVAAKKPTNAKQAKASEKKPKKA